MNEMKMRRSGAMTGTRWMRRTAMTAPSRMPTIAEKIVTSSVMWTMPKSVGNDLIIYPTSK